MTLTIGRATSLRVEHWRPSGDRASVSGTILAADATELDARRQQVLGLVDNVDEEVFPVTWSVDPAVDGFYRVSGAAVARRGRQRGSEALFTVDLERVGGYAAPWFEVLTQTVVRTNSHAITTPSGVIGAFVVPSGDSQYELSAIRSTTPTTRTLDTGDTLNIYKMNAPSGSAGYFRFATSPAEFYTGAATIEIKRGSTWYPVVGRQVAVTASTVWRISNGLVRLTSKDGATAGTFEMWDNTAAAWESQSIMHAKMPTTGGAALTAVAAGAIGQGPLGSTAVISVPRNSPEEVIVHVAGTDEWATWRLQRGSYNVECSIESNTTGYSGCGIGYTSSIGLTAFTSGVWRTTADANGNGLTFTSGSAVQDTRTGMIVWVGTSFAIGANLGVTDAATAALRRDEYLSALSWRQWVVVR